jgi:hypothetical protein
MMMSTPEPLSTHLFIESYLTVAMDCLVIVNDMARSFAVSYSMVLDEIKETSRMFELVKLRHENRLSNGEAHRLARSAASSSLGRQVWLVEPPGGLCIQEIGLNQ